MSDLDHFLGLETSVWRALVAGDAAADARHLSSDFLGVYPSGFAGRHDHVGQLDDGPTILAFDLTDTRLLWVSDEAVMFSYLASFTRPASPQITEAMFVSSLWCLRDGTWLNIFSQDTPALAG